MRKLMDGQRTKTPMEQARKSSAELKLGIHISELIYIVLQAPDNKARLRA